VVALFENKIVPNSSLLFAAATKLSIFPALFVTPVPLRVNVTEGLAVIVKALAPASKTTPLTSVVADKLMLVTLDSSNVPVSLGPLGTVAGVQLAAVFQSLVTGLRFQVALPAKTVSLSANTGKRMTTSNVKVVSPQGRGSKRLGDIVAG